MMAYFYEQTNHDNPCAERDLQDCSELLRTCVILEWFARKCESETREALRLFIASGFGSVSKLCVSQRVDKFTPLGDFLPALRRIRVDK
jgi:hypothetical protein